jgi:nucleoid DNA-binding protein
VPDWFLFGSRRNSLHCAGRNRDELFVECRSCRSLRAEVGHMVAKMLPVVARWVPAGGGSMFKRRSGFVQIRSTDTLGREMKRGGSVQITGFGTFSTVKRKARQGRNPKTGEAIRIAASTLPKYSAGATLKALVATKKK